MFLRTLIIHVIVPVFAVLVFFSADQINAQDAYYYHKGQKVKLKVKPDKNYVLFDAATNLQSLEQSLKSTDSVVLQFKETKRLKDFNQNAPKQYWAIVSTNLLKASPLDNGPTAEKILYKAPFFLTSKGKEVGLSHLFMSN